MNRLILMVCTLGLASAAGCSSGGDGASTGSGETAVETAVAAVPPTPASLRILGQWEVVAEAPSGSVRMGLEFTETALLRYSSGRVTAEVPAHVVEESEDSVLIELGEGSGAAPGTLPRERYRLVGDDGLVHEAVPELVFRRGSIAPHGPEPMLPDDTRDGANGSGVLGAEDASGQPPEMGAGSGVGSGADPGAGG